MLAYKVDQIKVVLPNETNDLLVVKNKDYVTLVTCTPYGVNTHRLIVRGERVPFEVEEKEAVVAQVNPFVVEKWMIGIVIVLLFFIGMFLYFKVKKR